MRSLLCATLLSAGLSATAHAGNLLDLAIVDRDTGMTLPTWADADNLYVAGTPGHRYSVRMVNHSGGRVLAVLSIDGVNAVSGQTASPDQTGYVLDAGESTQINGWRTSMDDVAQFNFTTLANSYATRTGRPSNVGVIGVAVFSERVPVWRAQEKIADAPMAARQAASPARSAQGAAKNEADDEASAKSAPSPAAQAGALARRDERIGTGYGAQELAHVDTTTFERASRWPAETVAIRYDSYANLVAYGIIARPVVRTEPQPFPGAFVPPPPRR
ncbi:MAG: hypothetical protein ABIO74_02005 [Dokdonella sp.]